MASLKPKLQVTVFSDYICPFCYIGDARLNRLRDQYDLKVNWNPLEIHPETSAKGVSVSSLGYSDTTWAQIMASLQALAAEDGLALGDCRLTTNSHSTLLLAEATKRYDVSKFYRLHQGLFETLFVKGDNIGDKEVLRQISRVVGLPSDLIDDAWGDPQYESYLQAYCDNATSLKVEATPIFIIGDKRLDGVVSLTQLYAAAADACLSRSSYNE
ncbi:MAG: DsbA family protein [Gammaproteobacteria bacterium]